MKRLILALATMASIAGPMAVAADAFAQNGRGGDRREWRDDRRGNDRGDRLGDRRDDRREWRGDRGDDRRDWDRGDRRGDRDWDRRGDNRNRWDDRRYNGYYYNNRWAYGAPPASYWGRPGFRPDYRRWQRGAYLPRHYNSYVIYDYPRYRLRPPPRGYYWVRANDDYVLAAIATGLILDVIAGGY